VKERFVPATATLEIGQEAPEFRLKGPGGQFVSLSEYRGHRNVVVVFFPLAFSPVCSHQLPAIQREYDRLRALDTEVLGISVDSHFANQAFARQLGVEFPLLSDWKREASARYGVLQGDHGIATRSVFVVDRNGRLIHKDVAANLDPGDASQIPSLKAVLAALEQHSSP
jgi:peroxiredoxin (alkyl hydroperoxide reductase subunit C)